MTAPGPITVEGGLRKIVGKAGGGLPVSRKRSAKLRVSPMILLGRQGASRVTAPRSATGLPRVASPKGSPMSSYTFSPSSQPTRTSGSPAFWRMGHR